MTIPALMPNYARIDLAFTHGTGPYLFGEDGRRYLDFSAGVAVTLLGHAHPHLITALTEQAAKVWHVSNWFRVPGQERLAERLVAASFGDSVLFCNSGAEALEGAIKLARKTMHDAGQPERYRIITATGAFHGRTLATIAAAGNPKYLHGFGPPVDGFDHVAFGNLNELRAAIGPQTAGILVEPVQGEGGVRAGSPDYLQGLRAVADEFGLVLIFDEVQCGMGRTGKLFAHEWAGIAPDIMALAKGIGGGFPVGAIVANERCARAFTPGTHGTTYGGNPLAMAVANAVLDVVLAPGFLDQVNESARALWAGLAEIADAHPAVITELRGAGLMIGLRCGPPCAEMQTALREAGLLTVTAGDNVVRLLPPLIIGPEQVAEALTAVRQAVTALAGAMSGATGGQG